MERNKDLTSQALLQVERRRRRNNENGINRKIDRMWQEERMRKIITELSREMIASRENEGTERDIQGVGWDMTIPPKDFLF